MVFDQLVGTYAREEPGVDMRYGLTDPIGSGNPFLIAFREWGLMTTDFFAAGSPKRALVAVFGRPGCTIPGASPEKRRADPALHLASAQAREAG